MSATMIFSAPLLVAETALCAQKSMFTTLKHSVGDFFNPAQEFLMQIPVNMLTSAVAQQITAYYHTKKGNLAIVQDVDAALHELHRDVLAALAHPITQAQQEEFAERLEALASLLPEIGLAERYFVGLSLYLVIQALLHKLEAQKISSALFSQKLGDKLVDTFVNGHEDTWEAALADAKDEIVALRRLIRDLPCTVVTA